MDRMTQLTQWWDGLDEDARSQARQQGRLTPEQRSSLKDAGLIDRAKPDDDDDDDDVIKLLRMRH